MCTWDAVGHCVGGRFEF